MNSFSFLLLCVVLFAVNYHKVEGAEELAAAREALGAVGDMAKILLEYKKYINGKPAFCNAGMLRYEIRHHWIHNRDHCRKPIVYPTKVTVENVGDCYHVFCTRSRGNPNPGIRIYCAVCNGGAHYTPTSFVRWSEANPPKGLKRVPEGIDPTTGFPAPPQDEAALLTSAVVNQSPTSEALVEARAEALVEARAEALVEEISSALVEARVEARAEALVTALVKEISSAPTDTETEDQIHENKAVADEEARKWKKYIDGLPFKEVKILQSALNKCRVKEEELNKKEHDAVADLLNAVDVSITLDLEEEETSLSKLGSVINSLVIEN